MDDYQDDYGNLPKDAPWWARWIVANWREGWRWWSSNWSILCGIGTEIYATHQPEIDSVIPSAWLPHIAAAAFVMTTVLRFVQQKPPTPPPPTDQQKE